jgi:signal transduction histidine kinase
MTDPFDGFGSLYVAALEAFLQQNNETTLSRAYELGRQAMVKGLGVLDMASLHHAALGVLVVSLSPPEQLRIGQTAAEFFAELLSPFEMSFRGYRAANEELQRLNESLRQQKEAVEIANRELEAFSYSVSHDLRAPLRTISAYSQFVLEDCAAALGDTGARHVHRIHEAARDMGELIDSLLSLARVTRAEIRRAQVNLTELAGQIAELLRTATPQRDVSIIVDDNIYATATRACSGWCWRTCWATPGSSRRSARSARSGSAASTVMGRRPTSCATTGPASTWTRPASCSLRSSACTRRPSSKVPGSGWRPCTA